ncbi:hypothetical protein G9A89_015560 [Geosiphon pyriformis]|nr:hypothetical protein G9A89_015560 [Geosiphon pyriformis]
MVTLSRVIINLGITLLPSMSRHIKRPCSPIKATFFTLSSISRECELLGSSKENRQETRKLVASRLGFRRKYVKLSLSNEPQKEQRRDIVESDENSPSPAKRIKLDEVLKEAHELVETLRQHLRIGGTTEKIWHTYCQISAKDAMHLLNDWDYMQLLLNLKVCESGSFVVDCLRIIRGDIREAKLELNNRVYNMMLHLYGRWEKYKTAESILREMTIKNIQPDIFTFTALISTYVSTGRARRAIQIFQGLKKGSVQPNVMVYNSILSAYTREMDCIGAFRLMEEMKKEGIQPNEVSYNILIHGYLQQDDIVGAMKCLDNMQENGLKPDLVTINTLMAGYCKYDRVEAAEKLYNKIFDLNLKPEVDTFTTLMASYARLGREKNVLEVFERLNFTGTRPNLWTFNILINMYIKTKDFEAAQNTLQGLSKIGLAPDAITYATIISGYVKIGNLEKARKYFREMRAQGILPNIGVFNTLLKGYLECHGMLSIGDIFKEMKEYNIAPNNVTYNTIMSYIKKQQDDDAFEKVIFQYEQMLNQCVRPTGRTFKIMLAMAAQKDFRTFTESSNWLTQASSRETEVDAIIREMKFNGIRMDVGTFAILIRNFIQRNDMESAKESFYKMHSKGLIPNKFIYKVLVEAYVKQKDIDMAEKVVEKMQNFGIQKDLELYTTLINGYTAVREYDKAGKEFEEMKNAGIEPDIVVYTSLLEMYAQRHDLKKAQDIFDYMEIRGFPIDRIAFTALMKAYRQYSGKQKSIYDEMIRRGRTLDHVAVKTILNTYDFERNTESYNQLLEKLVKRPNVAELAYDIFMEMLSSDKRLPFHIIFPNSRRIPPSKTARLTSPLPPADQNSLHIILNHLLNLENWDYIIKIWEKIELVDSRIMLESSYKIIIKALVTNGSKLPKILKIWRKFRETNPSDFSIQQVKVLLENAKIDIEKLE